MKQFALLTLTVASLTVAFTSTAMILSKPVKAAQVAQSDEIRVVQGQNVAINSYNAGYRAGRLEAAVELVECDKVKNKYVVEMYNAMSKNMARMGELDNSPTDCGK